MGRKKEQEEESIYIGVAILRRASATPCNQGNKQPVVLFNILVKELRQEAACKFNQSSNRCVPTIRYNRAPSLDYIEQQPVQAQCHPNPALFVWFPH
jgi:hypothetical protein